MNPLQMLDFPVYEEPVLTQSGKETGHKAIIHRNTGEVLAVNTQEYKTIPYRESLLPRVSAMLDKGWQLAPYTGRFGQRRPPTRLERGGRRAFAELVMPELEFEVGSDTVTPRMTITGSYDRSMSEHKRMGVFIIFCSNGAGIYHGKQHKSSIRHVGDVAEKISVTMADVDEFLNRFDSLREEWRSLEERRPDKRIIEAALVESLGERAGKAMLPEVSQFESGWRVYNRVTQALTYQFKGAEDTRNMKDRIAFNILSGRQQPAKKEELVAA